MNLKFEVTKIFFENYEAKEKVIVNEGGARSSKTYSILQTLITKSTQCRNKIFTIARKELATLKGTAMRDFFTILKDNDLYYKPNHNKTENTYLLNSNLFEFQGLDKWEKKRGAKRNFLFINEANEITYDDWQQLILRTEDQAFLDYNPSEEFSFIYDNILTRDDVKLIPSTFKDNPFIPANVKQEILNLQFTDPNAWRVYGLGKRGVSVIRIYDNWEICYDYPDYFYETIYGLDFGFNNPSALIEIRFRDEGIYVQEKFYKSRLTNAQLINEMKSLNISQEIPIYADCAEPARIEEIASEGYNIFAAQKDVADGIDSVKRHKIFIHQDSQNILREIKKYSWKQDRNGNILDGQPVKFDDHCMDAIRYGVYNSQPVNLKMAFV